MIPEAVAAFTAARDGHAASYKAMIETRAALVKSGVPSLTELADAIYALDRVERIADDLRKEARAFREQLDKIACLRWVERGDGEPIRTEHCLGTPQIKQMAPMPNRHKHPERYAALMQHLGIAKELWDAPEGFSPPIELKWTGMVDYLTERLANGKPVPPGVDPRATFTIFRVNVRAKKDVAA